MKKPNTELRPRFMHTATLVKRNRKQFDVYILGGTMNKQKAEPILLSFELKNDPLFWVLHILEATGIQRMIGLNMI